MGKRNTGKSTKLFGLFNLLDLLILVFLFALVGTLVLRSNLKESFAGTADDVTIDFSVRVEPVRVMTYMAVKEGDPLFDDETGVQIGTVTRVTATPYLREATLIDGTMVTSPDPEYLTVIIMRREQGKRASWVSCSTVRGCARRGAISRWALPSWPQMEDLKRSKRRRDKTEPNCRGILCKSK